MRCPLLAQGDKRDRVSSKRAGGVPARPLPLATGSECFGPAKMAAGGPERQIRGSEAEKKKCAQPPQLSNPQRVSSAT